MATSSQNQGLSKYVTLISSDGFEFVVLREAACISKAIKKMLDGESSSQPRSRYKALMLYEHRELPGIETCKM
jgi:Skp1 family, tetramerisation domain